VYLFMLLSLTQVCSGVGTRGHGVPMPFCTRLLSNVAAISDALATRRFALLVKILQWNRKILCGNSWCSPYSDYLVQSSHLFGVGTAFRHLFF